MSWAYAPGRDPRPSISAGVEVLYAFACSAGSKKSKKSNAPSTLRFAGALEIGAITLRGLIIILGSSTPLAHSRARILLTNPGLRRLHKCDLNVRSKCLSVTCALPTAILWSLRGEEFLCAGLLQQTPGDGKTL